MITPRKIPISFPAVFWIVQLVHAGPSDFTLQSATDSKTFKLSDAKGKYVALHFLLKTECPDRMRYTDDYLQKAAGDSRVVHVFLKPDNDGAIGRALGVSKCGRKDDRGAVVSQASRSDSPNTNGLNARRCVSPRARKLQMPF